MNRQTFIYPCDKHTKFGKQPFYEAIIIQVTTKNVPKYFVMSKLQHQKSIYKSVSVNLTFKQSLYKIKFCVGLKLSEYQQCEWSPKSLLNKINHEKDNKFIIFFPTA